jgi:hypothetical protein
MASTTKHLRSSTASKRPTASGLAEGQLAINTASGTPGLFLKDNAGAVVKVGPAHVGASAPNATPAGSAGNSIGELWVNNSGTINGLNYYTGVAFVNLTPSGTTAVAGLVELATDAETQTGTDTIRAVTPSGLQSKVSDSTSTTSSTTIASSAAVKSAYDLANAALPKTGGIVTGALEIGTTGSLSFEGSSDDSFETTLAVVNPTADRTITLPNTTGTVITTGDTGTVTSAIIADDTIVNADINASAAIALSKLATGALPTAITIASANIVDGAIVNADINASAAIVDTKLATIATAGKVSNSATTATSASTPSGIVARDASGNFAAGDITIGDKIIHDGDTDTTIRFPAANIVAVETAGSERIRVDSSGRLVIGATTARSNLGPLNLSAALQVEGTDYTTSSLSLLANGATSTSDPSPVLHFARSRGASVGSNTIVQSGDSLGVIDFEGSDGTDFPIAARIQGFVGGTPGAGDMPGLLALSTAAGGTATPTERMRIDSQGRMGFNSTFLGGVSGAYRFAGSITGAVSSQGILYTPTIQSDSTTSATVFVVSPATASNGGTPYTITTLRAFLASQSTFNADSTVTNQYGFEASSILTGATNNYGFFGNLASATGRWNFYASGTAPNYFTGDVRTNTVVTARTAPANSNTSATATASSLLDGLRTGTPTGNITLTLPTGTDMDAAFQDLQANQSFEWSVINLAAATHLITVTAAAGHTVVGNMAVAAATSGRFITRKTAANTFISYRIA